MRNSYQNSQYQSMRTMTSAAESRSGRASPAGFNNSMPESRPAPYQQRPYSPSNQRSPQYDNAQYPKPALEYGRPQVPGSPPVPGSFPTPMSALSSDSSFTPMSALSRDSSFTTTRHKNSWLEEARESTANFKKHGSPLPLVWILVEDKTIPPNAVPFGEDRNGSTFFIARAHLEGGLHIGKVGHHTRGALITFVGKEHVIEKYEVLVCASQLRWGLPSHDAVGTLVPGTVILARQQHSGQELSHTKSVSFGHEFGRTKTGNSSWSREARESTSSFETTLRVEDIPRFIPDPKIKEEELRRVAEYKTVILIDDSLSMTEGDSWNQVGEALAGIVDIAMQYGSKGLDLHFMHEEQYAENIKTRYDVQKLFEQYGPNGEDTPTGARLGQIIDMYLPLIEHPNSTHEPVSIIVITDGAATDGEELVRYIVEAASRLDRQRVPLDKFGIQFLQIGMDEEAARALRVLDDELSARFKIRDIVDATPFDHTQGGFSTDYMLKILIGSLNKELDNALPPNEVLPPGKRVNLSPPAFDTRSPPMPRPSSPYVPVGNLL
ncbi:hypothetical protein AZE42_03499 [Rhizopogon vesiculosus]|uniref:Uncharacterized protein n=1 Tax=Rhizopogon vesiculosus TaxID=180088 RepID=A0A1J8QGX0_9AGAM|nr:hypothetical protein AZE42_03499 [Rhizopogon vesiculosus]